MDAKKLADYYRDLGTIVGLCFSNGERETFTAYHRMNYWAKQYPGAGFDPELDIYFDKAQAGIGRISHLDSYMKTLSVCREKKLSYRHLNRENGEYAGGVSRKYTPDEIMKLPKLMPAELEELTAFFEELDTPVRDDAVVLQKVMEQADACVFEETIPDFQAIYPIYIRNYKAR